MLVLKGQFHEFEMGTMRLRWIHIKGTVSRDFGGLQMIFMNRAWVTDVPLEVYLFKIFIFLYSSLSSKFVRVKLLLMHLAEA